MFLFQPDTVLKTDSTQAYQTEFHTHNLVSCVSLAILLDYPENIN